MKKVTKKLVFGTMSLVLATAFMGCSDGNGANNDRGDGRLPYLSDEVQYPYEGEDTIGDISDNLVAYGNADDDEDAASGAINYSVEGGAVVNKIEGGASGKCYQIRQEGGTTEDDKWEEFYFDITKFYGQGKSYLLSFKLKADNSTGYESEGKSLSISYSCYSGAVKEWATAHKTEHYNFDDKGVYYDEKGDLIMNPWGNPWSNDEDTYLEAIIETSDDEDAELATNSEIPITNDWVQYYYVLSSTELETIINNTGVYNLAIAFSAGPEGIGGYSYLLDDIVIKDLNADLDRQGQTWQDPNASQGSDDEDIDDSDDDDDDE